MQKRSVFGAAIAAVLLFPSFTAVANAQEAPAAQTVRVGDFTVRTLTDAHFHMPLSLLTGIDPQDAVKLNGGSDSLWAPANAYLVRMPNRIVLVDAGLGHEGGNVGGHLTEELKQAGVDPSSIDLVLITHFHFDHIGGLLTAEGKRMFPNAVVRASKAESDYWLGDTSAMPVTMRGGAATVRKVMDVYIQAKAFRPFSPDEDLGDGIKALPAHGHTPGHTVYAFTSKGQTLWCVGDLIHYGTVQFTHPEVGVTFDTDRPAAIAIRKELFRRAAEEHIILAGAHLPAIVRLVKSGDGFEATAVEGAAESRK